MTPCWNKRVLIPRAVLIGTAALLLLFTPHAAYSQAKQPVKIVGFTFPEQLAGARIGRLHDFEIQRPGLGYGIEYLRSGWKMNLYIYSYRQPKISGNLDSPLMKKHYGQVKADILRAQKSGRYSYVRAVKDFQLKDTAGRPRFLCSSFQLGRKDIGDSDSYLCLGGWRNMFVKTRVSARHGPQSETEFLKFMNAWTRLFWPKP